MVKLNQVPVDLMKHPIKKIILFLISLLLSAAGKVNAQAPASLSGLTGNLVNDQGKPVAYAAVSLLKEKDSSIVKGTLTKESGEYSFEKIAPGTYMIAAHALGYSRGVSKAFKVIGGENNLTVPIILMHTLSHDLQTVSITAAAPLIERRTDRIVMNVENSILAAGNSALEILEKAPGIAIDKDDHISLNGRQGVTVMLDDKLTYLSTSQLASLLRSTDGNTIRNIEIISNPSAKYDAAGNAGIINIRLKRYNQSGTNGNLTLGAGLGKYFRDNASVSLNHREGKMNFFGTYSRSDNKRAQDIRLSRIIDGGAGVPTYFSQHTQVPYQDHNNSYRIGADYDVTKNNSIGLSASGYFNQRNDRTLDDTKIGPGMGIIDSTARTIAENRQSYKDFALNLSDRLKIDTAGQEISIDLDYSKVNNNAAAAYHNDFFFADGSAQHPSQLLTNQTPSVIDIRTVKADYTKSLSKSLKFEGGIKYSNVQTDNDLQARILEDGTLVNDTNRTNHFIYDEKITASYINFIKKFSHTLFQLGLRSEYTQSQGHLLGSTPVNRHYLDFFPSLAVTRTLNEKNEISISYNRRIDRPGYEDLNPFVYFLDPYTFAQGNAFLIPQYTHSFQLNYLYHKLINVSMNYSLTTNAITQIVLTTGNRSVSTQRNLDSHDAYDLSISSPYTVSRWWTGNINIDGFYQRYKADTIAGSKLDNQKANFRLRSTQTLTLGKFKAEVMGIYYSSQIYGIYSARPVYSIDAGLSRSFADKKATLKLSVSDIFNTRKSGISSHLLNNNFNFQEKDDTRVGRLTFIYSFGDHKVKANQHQSGAEDEAERVKKN